MDRVLHALNHPVRRRILRALVDGDGSASTLAKTLRLNLGIVSYHLNQVLARECKIVELVESVPKRGAIEKVYALRAMSFEECLIIAAAAMDADALTSREGSAWKWFCGQVDDQGWSEICDACADFNRRAQVAVAGSGKRTGKTGAPHDVVVGVAAFPAVSPPSPAHEREGPGAQRK